MHAGAANLYTKEKPITTPKLAKVCAVVGIGPGLGRALCRRFGREGFEVTMLACSVDRLETLRQTLAEENIVAHAYKADAGDPESLALAFDDLQTTLGSSDVIIYNAVAFHPGAASGLTNKALTDDLQTSVVGALAATKRVLPAMVERNMGTLLFTGGGAGINP